MIQVKEISLQETYPIRLTVLRPNKTLADCVFAHDEDRSTFHLGVFVEDKLVCTGSFYMQKHPYFKDEDQCQLRGMATLPEYQGKGMGKRLIQKALELLFARNLELFWCNARSTAIGFYQGQGLQTIGNEFEVSGIGPHYVMYCRL